MVVPFDPRAEIARAFPKLEIGSVSFLGAGVDSAAYLINEEWVFRFPKGPDVSDALAREIALLPKLAPQLPVAVPQFEHVGRQSGSGLLFVGYRLIPGEPLEPDLFEALSDDTQQRVLQTLADFIQFVHAVPIGAARQAGVEPLSTRDLVGSTWAAARELALARLAPADGAALTAMIQRFLADGANFAGPDCLLYADFAPEHILYDRAAERITGIIDWGDMAIGDPDYDLTYLYQDYGPAFVERLLAYLPHPDPDRLFEKLRVFCAYDYLHDVAQAQTGEKSEADLEEAVAGLCELVR
jgi:aminoglycoside 2''-phosphotransferase